MDKDLYKEIELLRNQVRNQEKMASLGVLSAGIAHEIRNPLNFVINFSRISARLIRELEDLLGSSPNRISADLQGEYDEIIADLKDNIKKIEENGERAADIIRDILFYSGGREDEFIPTDLRRLIKKYVALSFHAARANNKEFNVSLREDYQEIPPVRVIPRDLSRAVINLMNNACYAVSAKCDSSRDDSYSPVISISLRQVGKMVKLVIEDNGTGISEEVKEHLFSPFYTTKPAGEGTGLGLSITKSIIEEKHEGTIEVESESGKFSRFTISLPVK